MKTLSLGVDISVNDIGCKDMARIRVGIAEEIGEGDGGEGVIVGKIILEKLHDGIR